VWRAQDVIRTTMREKYAAKGEAVSEEFFNSVTHEVSTAAMKYALLSASCTVCTLLHRPSQHAQYADVACVCCTAANLVRREENHVLRGRLRALHPVQLHAVRFRTSARLRPSSVMEVAMPCEHASC
jgi:hypothetical protein